MGSDFFLPSARLLSVGKSCQNRKQDGFWMVDLYLRIG